LTHGITTGDGTPIKSYIEFTCGRTHCIKHLAGPAVVLVRHHRDASSHRQRTMNGSLAGSYVAPGGRAKHHDHKFDVIRTAPRFRSRGRSNGTNSAL
jgi:hypothetical protein